MRTVDELIINGEKNKFIEIIYYDGPKLLIDIFNHSIFLWYKGYSTYESWLKVDTSTNDFKKYIANEVSLLQLMQNPENSIFKINRMFDSYDVLVSERITKEDIRLPKENSFLGFDFRPEIEHYTHLNEQVINLFSKSNYPIVQTKKQTPIGNFDMWPVFSYQKGSYDLLTAYQVADSYKQKHIINKHGDNRVSA